MSCIRIYQPKSLKKDEIIQLDLAASHHVARVLRATLNEKIYLFNGDGKEYQGIIRSLHPKKVEIELTEVTHKTSESPLAIHLGQALTRGEKMDWIVQKSVELGAHSITPLLTQRCKVKFDKTQAEKRRTHWQSVAISACEQSGRTVIPHISPVLNIQQWLQQANGPHRYVLAPQAAEKLTIEINQTIQSVYLLIGPEGGLTEQEIAEALEHQFKPLSLGPRILRTETAPIATISLFQALWGDMGNFI